MKGNISTRVKIKGRGVDEGRKDGSKNRRRREKGAGVEKCHRKK